MKHLFTTLLCVCSFWYVNFAQGNICEDPIIVNSLPYTLSETTSDYGDDYSPNEGPCFSDYLGGDDIVFEYTPMVDEIIDIVLTGTDNYVGLFVFLDCPFTTCLALDEAPFSNPQITGLELDAGTTYYLVISSWPPPQSTFFELSISQTPCIPVSHGNYFLGFSDCPNSVSFSFEITDMGTASSIEVTNDLGGTNPPDITSPGIYTITDLPSPGVGSAFFTPDDDISCFVVSGPWIVACPPENEDCTDALDISADINAGPTMYVNNTYAADGINPFSTIGCNTFNSWCNDTPCYRDTWYAVTPTALGCIAYLSVSTLESSFDTKIAIYDDCGTVISGNDDFHGASNLFTSLATASIVSGQTYYIQVGAYSSSENGDVVLDVQVLDISSTSSYASGITTADMECTGLDGWTHYINTTTSEVVLSINKSGEDIGWVPMTASMSVSTNAEAGTFDAGLVSGCGAFYAYADYHPQMNRTWDVLPGIQPSIPVDVRAYYTTDDYNKVDDAYAEFSGSALSGHTDLIHYKIDYGEEDLYINPCHSDDNVGAAIYSEPSYTYGTCVGDHYAEFSVTSFSGGGAGAAFVMPLPLDLISFTGTATDNKNELRWKTANEIDVEKFILQKSKNGLNTWLPVAEVLSYGNSIQKQEYSSIDRYPFHETYYRLKSVDLDESFSYSNIIVLTRNKENLGIVNIFPNPTSNSLNIDLNLTPDMEYNIEISNVMGARDYYRDIIKSDGSITKTIDVSNWESGIYLVSVVNNNSTYLQKFIKQ